MSTIKRKTVTVGLLWHSVASGNLGVVALTLSQLAIIQQAAEEADVNVHVKIFGWQLDGSMPTTKGFESIAYYEVHSRSLISPSSIIHKEFAKCDLILDVGEGDSFSDIYGLKRLLYLCLSKKLATAGGAKLVLSPQTLGPFASKLYEKIACWSLKNASCVFARDHISMEWASKHLPAGQIQEAIDMAFCLPFEKRQKSETSKIQIGINVSALLYYGGYGGGNSLGLSLDYKSLTHRMMEWALATPHAEVWLIPHVYSRGIPEEDDPTACLDVKAIYPEVNIAGPFVSPTDAKTFISGLDFFSGGRMHACIGAFSSGVPTVPLAYSRKFNGLFQSLNYPILADCKVMNEDQVMNIIQKSFTERDTVRKQVQHSVALAHNKLNVYRQFITQSFKDVKK
ncbi:MAG: hypothetical protein RLZZ352_1457 [Pseudomonadota bacterium]|jgi:polysaccharide pyruvyl transferase WcaK-like protein